MKTGLVTGSLLLIVALASSACKDKSPAADPGASVDAGPPATASASAPSASAPAPTASVDPGQMLSLMDRIAAEGRNRPPIKPSADDVLAALVKTGGPMTRAKPSLAATYKASYCTGGYIGNETLALDVCEFPDVAAGAAGLAFANSVFTNMKNRKVWGRKQTTLTIIEQKSDPATLALEKRLVAAYQEL
jgi:hypothetical protein